MRYILMACGLASIAGCSGKDDAPQLLDTGWFDDTGTVTGECQQLLVLTDPEDGDTGWYWRDRPGGGVLAAGVDVFDAWLVDDAGNRIDTEMVWDDAQLQFELEWDGWLKASTTYTMVVQDCVQTHEITFTTSDLGTPLAFDASELQGNTYLLDLEGADWVEPAVLAGLISEYLTDPILLGVTLATETTIDLLGAPGLTDEFGNVTQADAPTWDFPFADFSDQPFLDAQVDLVVLQYDVGSVIDIPVENFVLQGTFTSDGTAIGGGVLSGVGDTREIGELLGGKGTLCKIAGGLGVDCIPCSDGEPYCLELVAQDLNGELQPGLVLVAQ